MGSARRAIVSAMLCTVVRVGVAHAQSDDPEGLYQRAITLREQRRDVEALELFQRVFRQTHAARDEAQVALAEGQVGRLVDAEAHLVDALSQSRDRWIRRNRASLDDALERLRERLGGLVVECDTPGAELWIDGARASSLPIARPVRVVAGTVTFEVRAQGFVTATRRVQVPRDPVRVERVDALSAEAPVVAPVVEVSPPRAEPPPRAAAPAPTPYRGPGVQRTLAWVGLGASALVLVGGVVAMSLRESAAARYNTEFCAGGDAPSGDEPSDACRSDRSAASTMQTLGIAGFAVGGAMAVASLVALVTSPSASERGARATLRCGGGPGVIGLSCGGAF